MFAEGMVRMYNLRINLRVCSLSTEDRAANINQAWCTQQQQSMTDRTWYECL